MERPKKTQLGQYLLDEGLTAEDFRRKLTEFVNRGRLGQRRKVDQSMVSYWRRGRMQPSLDYAVAIEIVTDGAVPVSSWAHKWALGE